MSGVAQSFSQLSRAGTSFNSRWPSLAIPGGQKLGGLGPLGFSGPRTQVRQQLDKTFGVPPSEGDPGYVPPGPPVVTPVTPMPIPGQDDLANISARRKSIEQQLFRRGRMSTVLSNPQTEPLGG